MPAHRKNYDDAVRLYESKLSIGEIALFFGITRQAMHTILKRRSVIFRKQQRYGKDNHFWRGTKAHDRAQNILEQAINKNIIKRADKCEQCGRSGNFKNGRTNIQAHHCDYNKPLDVKWLCQLCHHLWHKENNAVRYKNEIPKSVQRGVRRRPRPSASSRMGV